MLFNEIKGFLSEIKTDNFTVSNNENMTSGFTLFGGLLFSPLLNEFSAKKSCSKGIN